MTGTAQLAEEFFIRKVFDVCIQLASRCQQTVNTVDGHCEQAYTASAFSGIVRKCPMKSSVLDQLPTSLVKANIDILVSTLAKIINMLLSLDQCQPTSNTW